MHIGMFGVLAQRSVIVPRSRDRTPLNMTRSDSDRDPGYSDVPSPGESARPLQESAAAATTLR
jgi:hypothetical protein